MRSILISISLISLLLAPATAAAGTWVPSPTTVPASTGMLEAGGGCCGWINPSGNYMLFFDIWSGAWTEFTLPESHTPLKVLGSGNLMLIVCSDLAIVYNGPLQTIHQQPLSGTLLDGGATYPGCGCADELAAVVTDDMFYVFDGRLDEWRVLDYDYPAVTTYFYGVVTEPDYVATELDPISPGLPINLAYSLRTRTFLETYAGITNLRSGRTLDHGFAGTYGAWPDAYASGWSAFTGALTTPVEVHDGYLSSYPVDRTRRDLCHLMTCTRNVNVVPYTNEFTWWIYDSITGTWSSDGFAYDTRDTAPYESPSAGGQIVGLTIRYNTDNSHSVTLFDGRTHGVTTQYPGLIGSGVGRIDGGSVLAFHDTHVPSSPAWWCCSLEHPAGNWTSTTHTMSSGYMAGEDWFCTAERSSGDPVMDMIFYHGPSNSITTVEMGATTGSPVAGAHVVLQTSYGEESDAVFYSSILDFVTKCPVLTYVSFSRFASDHLALAYSNGTADFLFDARTGVVHERGLEYNSNSLGDEVVVAFDPALNVAHAYSSVLGDWTTQAVGEDGYGWGGGLVGFARTNSGAHYWGFNALDGAWTELVTTGSFPSQDVGGSTILVRSSDRVWAYWPYDTTDVAEGREPDERPALLEYAVAGARCHPNPFNGRTVMDFALPVRAAVRIEVFDLRGRKVATLLDETREPGNVTAVWETGRAASGTYVVRLEAGGVTATRKVTLVQ